MATEGRPDSLFFRGLPPAEAWTEHKRAYRDVQTARILDSMVRTVAEKGYTAATVADVVKGAGVSRRTFYEQFPDKEACFLAAYETGAQTMLQEIADAVRQANPATWQERVRASLQAYTAVMAAEPDFARTLLVEVQAAGPEALAQRRVVLASFVGYYRALREGDQTDDRHLAAVPDLWLRALVIAIDGLVQEHIVTEGAESIERLTSELSEMAIGVLSAPGAVSEPA